MYQTMLDWYNIGGYSVLMTNVDNGINEPIHGYQNGITCQILIFGGYLKLRQT
jgi:hypothetical protein